MSYKVAINGFGRIGRNAFKIAMNYPELEIVAVNDLTSTDTLAYLLKHDSNYGTYHEEVGHDDQNLIVSGRKIRVTAEKDPALLPWKDLGVDIVIESIGRFTKAEAVSALKKIATLVMPRLLHFMRRLEPRLAGLRGFLGLSLVGVRLAEIGR
jgi:glyceraldehyde-3-phosphate dehydrogenase/erythrose-4-phosphate dehydrogenase